MHTVSGLVVSSPQERVVAQFKEQDDLGSLLVLQSIFSRLTQMNSSITSIVSSILSRSFSKLASKGLFWTPWLDTIAFNMSRWK